MLLVRFVERFCRLHNVREGIRIGHRRGRVPHMGLEIGKNSLQMIFNNPKSGTKPGSAPDPNISKLLLHRN